MMHSDIFYFMFCKNYTSPNTRQSISQLFTQAEINKTMKILNDRLKSSSPALVMLREMFGKKLSEAEDSKQA